jgi:hypothetical protein
MVRTQIQLTEEQDRQLKRWSAGLGISLAEAVRRWARTKPSVWTGISQMPASTSHPGRAVSLVHPRRYMFSPNAPSRTLSGGWSLPLNQ